MKNAFLVLVLASCSLFSIESHALVRTLANCLMKKGPYRVAVLDNQGIGPERVSHVVASLTDVEGKVVAQFPAELYRGPHSASYGRPHYEDVATQGKQFLLEGPATNVRHYSVHAIVNGAVVQEDGLECAVFGGAVVETN